MDKAQTIIEFIKDELLDDDDVEIALETSLFQDRILDSLNLITLISFLEKTFNIKINTTEVIIENLDSVGNMVAFLGRKGVA